VEFLKNSTFRSEHPGLALIDLLSGTAQRQRKVPNNYFYI